MLRGKRFKPRVLEVTWAIQAQAAMVLCCDMAIIAGSSAVLGPVIGLLTW